MLFNLLQLNIQSYQKVLIKRQTLISDCQMRIIKHILIYQVNWQHYIHNFNLEQTLKEMLCLILELMLKMQQKVSKIYTHLLCCLLMLKLEMNYNKHLKAFRHRLINIRNKSMNMMKRLKNTEKNHQVLMILS